MTNKNSQTDLSKKLAGVEQAIKETHGKSLYGPFYNPPEQLGKQDPGYLKMREKLQKELTGIYAKIEILYLRTQKIEQELENLQYDWSKYPPIIEGQIRTFEEYDQKLGTVNQILKRNLLFTSPDFIVPLFTFLFGTTMLFIGIFKNIPYFPVIGGASIIVAVLHLVGKRK